MRCRLLAPGAILIGLGLAGPATAPALPLSGSIGPALAVQPAYPGASAYTAALGPTGRLGLAGRLHLDLRTAPRASLDVAAPGRWRFAVLGQYLPGRDAALRADYAGLSARGPGLGLGATAERSRGPLSLRLGLYRDATRRTGGWGGWAAAEAQTRLGLTPFVAGVEGVLEGGSAAHLAQRFGVAPAEAGAAGELSAYRPEGGLARATLRATAVYLASRHWAIVGRVAGARLGPALAASPIVATPWQGRLGAGLLYRF